MPSKSKSQQRLFGMVVTYKKGNLPDASDEVKELAKGVTLKQAELFAHSVQEELDRELTLIKQQFNELRQNIWNSLRNRI